MAASAPLSRWLADRRVRPGEVVDADAVVIGSGYGGAVAALRLAEEGREVLVMERGGEFQPGDFPSHAGHLPKYVRAHGLSGTLGQIGGLFDFRVGQGMASLVANGLGGGSLINAGVMMRPDADVFAQPSWPAEIRHGLDERLAGPGGRGWGLNAAFARAAAMLRGELFDDAVPPHHPAPATSTEPGVSSLPKAQALFRMGHAMRDGLAPGNTAKGDAGLDFEARPARVTIDLNKCTRCGDCLTGCNRPGAKLTLLDTYLKHAHAAGATLVTGCLVYSIQPAAAGEWLVRVLPAEKERHSLRLCDAVQRDGWTIRARLVIVAAGAYGSTELLMRSQRLHGDFSLSAALATRLSGNGDSLSVLCDLDRPVGGVGHGAEDVSARKVGPTITTVLDLRQRREIDQRVVIQEGAVPGALAAVYRELLATGWTFRHLGTWGRSPKANEGLEPMAASARLAQHTQILLAMGHDGSRGRLVWMPEMDGAVPFWPAPETEATFHRQQQLFDAAEKKGGGVHLHPPTWRLVGSELAAAADGALPKPIMMSVHPLGGCPMGDSFESGVVDHLGRVWRRPHELWDNLYVLDGSIVPTSLGCNPLWTITALAERAMARRAPAHPCTRASQPAPAAAASVPVRRSPQATSRAAAPAVDMAFLERLERRDIQLRGRLRDALNSDTAEGEIRISMRSADWQRVWEDPRHRISAVTGKLTLLVPPSGDAPASASDLDETEAARAQAPASLSYDIAGGYVELFSPEARAWRSVRRSLRFLRVALSWLILRGWRDRLEMKRPGEPDFPWLALVRLGWNATEVRFVRYRLVLRSSAPDARAKPHKLWLTGKKTISYAASWTEICRHVWRRLAGRDDPSLDTRPGDLRASLLHQLTQPAIRLDTTAWRRLLPSRFSEVAEVFDFDGQNALQRSPVRLYGSGDSTTAALAALAYPAFLVRYLLQTRLLDFRLPSYSGDPLADTASPEDVWLRNIPEGWDAGVRPTEYALEVAVGKSSSDDGSERPSTSKVRLRLWRYRRPNAEPHTFRPPDCQEGTWCGKPVRRARSVLLMHAFDMSGLSFTFKSTSRNFAEHLYGQGWEVWILDSRMSPRTLASIEPCTVDQLGFIDAPTAVDFILGILRGELPPGDAPLQIFGFGQCMGAASLLIGLLGGRLSYDIDASANHRSATGIVPQMPKLAGLVTSQTHPFIIGSRSAQAKTWVPGLLRDYAGRTMVPLGVRGPVTSVIESLADRLFAAFPVPPRERCHGEGEPHRVDDDCATCRRIRFLLGGMFRHANLNPATHRELPKLFGAGSVRLFAQGAKFFRYERLCSEDGHNVYATDQAIGRYLALPLRFLHGSENDLFDQESATRSARQYRRIHPGWAERFGLMDTVSGKNQVCDVIPGYGHVDVLIGDRAMESIGSGPSVYDRLSALLDRAWATPKAAACEAPFPSSLIARFPRSGPFLGPIVHRDDRSFIGIAFIVDDTNAESPDGAAALISVGGVRQLVELRMRDIAVSVPARDGDRPPRPNSGLVGLRVAFGHIDVTAHLGGNCLPIWCVSWTRTVPGPLQPFAAAHCAAQTPSAAELGQAIHEAQAEVDRLRTAAQRPFPLTLSARLRFPRPRTTMLAQVPRHVLRMPRPGDTIRVAIGCCRYGGFPFERTRADAALHRLVQLAGGRRGVQRPELLFMLGDQIYADRTAGLIDELSPTERFFFRHHEAFTTDAARKLFSMLPTVCLPDDHEFVDSYPLGRPLVPHVADQPNGGSCESQQRERAARAIALQAIEAYQLSQLPSSARDDGYCLIDRGRVRFFVMDTRMSRRRQSNGTVVTLQAATRCAFQRWVRQCAKDDAIGCLVTSSVILPGLHPGADPANMGPIDSMQASPAERAWLLGKLARHLPGRFVLLSGDYHLSFVGEVCLAGQVVGAAVVAPPFYAPLIYANAQPEDLWVGETVRTGEGSISVRSLGAHDGPLRGSGFGTLDFVPDGTGWRVKLRAEVIDFERSDGWFSVSWPDVRLSGRAPSSPAGAAPEGTLAPAER